MILLRRGLEAAPAAIAMIAALATGVVGLARGTWAAGGSDSSCYALMADAFAHGRLQPTSTLASAPWPDVSRTLAPAGFIPSPVRADAASPICAPGFALFLAPLAVFGGADAIFLLTPLAGSVLVWLAWRLGRRLAGDWAGAMAAVMVAATPILLFQVVQPMNDVFVSALWLGAVVALGGSPPRLVPGGALVGAALLVRPNLLPAALAVAVWVFTRGRAADPAPGRRGGIAALARFGLAAAPFALLVPVLNHALYGGALRSGYGQAMDLFAWANVPENLSRHLLAIVETQAGLPLLGLAAPLALGSARREAALPWLVAVAIAACYLPYQPFREWWYLRFLIPSLVLLVTLACAVAVRAATAAAAGSAGGRTAWGMAVRGGVAALAAILAVHQVRVAAGRQAFDLWRTESRYRHVAEAMLDHLPPRTVAMAVWDSGSIRFHAWGEIVMWDALDPGWLDRGAAWLLAQGRPPVIVVERWEEPLFRARFGARSAIGGLDWPPRVDVDGLVRIYDPADRHRYLAGQQVETAIVAPRR